MKFYTIVILTAFAILFFSSCNNQEKPTETPLRLVKYEEVGTSGNNKIRTYSGIAKAGDEIELSFRTSGIITTLNARVGTRVKKGELIAKLDNVQAELAFQQSVSALKSAESSLNTANSSLDRVKSLYEKGSSSLSDYEKAKNSYQTALDQYESAKRNKSIKQSQISYGIIKAPKSGVIAIRNSELNETISSGKVIAVLNAGNQINVMVGIPENVINETQIGMDTKIAFSAIKDQAFQGTIIEVSPIIDSNSATYPIKINITNPTTLVKPGMAANVIFNFSPSTPTTNNSLYVPLKAVGEDSNGNFVFLVESNNDKTGIITKRTIRIGELTSSGFIVKGGLISGDKIATAGLQTLLDGQKVRLQ